MSIKRTPIALAVASVLFSAGLGAAGIPHNALSLHVTPQHVAVVNNNPLVGPDGKAGVMIVLKGDPATVTYAQALQAAGRGIVGEQSANNAARATITSLQQQQASFVTNQLDKLGVSYQEMFRTQRVLNGIAVRMRPEDMAKVRNLPNVLHVDLLPVYKHPQNITSVPSVNAPQVWNGGNQLGLPFNATGRNIKIGDIDTGLDYIHPDFGGTGLLADYQDVDPTSVVGKNSHNIIFPTNKVVGGFDFAGDDYDASNAPTPDANPMDCGGHGSHTAGTLAGVGVNADGTPYGGLYNPIAPYAANLKIGPGMAPEAHLYALRVFGCGGSTNLVTEAIEWATDPNNNGDLSDHLDVINMSLGSSFGVDIGGSFNSDIAAVENAALVGLISVSAAGNDGDTFFIASAPGAAKSGIMVAASVDPGIPGVVLNETAPNSQAFVAQASGYTNPANPQPPAPANQSGTVFLANDGGTNPTRACAAFSGTNYVGLTGKIALIDRGTCNFTVKVQNAQAAGAIGAIIIDNATSPLPIAMGGAATTQITIPGISVSNASGAVLKPLSGTASVTFTAATAADTLASFSSRGPVTGQKSEIEARPDLAAPGLNIPSVQTGYTCDGNVTVGCITPNASGFLPGGQVLVISGTSMATPHVAGMMALLRQLNPNATVEELKAMAINGAGHDVTLGANQTLPYFAGPRVGAGRIDAAASATNKVLAYNADDAGSVSVTFDVEPMGTFTSTHTVTLANRTATAQMVALSLDTKLSAAGASFSVPGSTIAVPANGSTTFDVTLSGDTTQMLRSFDPTQAKTGASTAFGGFALPRDYISEESAVIKVLDTTNGNAELARVPVYAALRPHSNITTAADLGSSAPATGTTNVALSGQDVCTGTLAAGPTCNFTHAAGTDEESLVSTFELQYKGVADPTLPGWANLHYVGVNSGPDGTDTDVFFGIATYGKWGSPTYASYNVCIDSDGDGLFDKILANTDLGTIDSLFGVPGAEPQDTFVAMIYDHIAGQIGFDFSQNLYAANVVDTGTLSNNTLVLGAVAADLGLTSTQFHYGVAVCPGFNPLCGSAGWGTSGGATCGNANAAYQSISGPFVYDSSKPGVDGAGNVLLEDLNGGSIQVDYNVNNLVGNGSNAMLLLHTHNGVSNSAQVVVLDRIFADEFGP